MKFAVKVASLSLLVSWCLVVWAGPLRNVIEVPAYRGSVSGYLDLIETHSNVYFSYNPNYIPSDSTIREDATTDKLSNILNNVFDEKISYKESGSYVILKPKKTTKPKKSPTSSSDVPKENKYTITGRVVNSLTGEVISEAVVYDRNRLTSTVTDDQGYYALTVSASNDFIPISISKSAYADTLIIVEPYKSETGQIDLKPITPVTMEGPKIKRIERTDSNRVEQVGIVQLVVPDEVFSKTNSQQVEFSRPAQVSFLPMIGTNRAMGGLVENNFSLNILAGYSGGVKGVEVGGLVNITRFNVEGLQLAGLGNITGGTVSGVQIGGFFNNNRGTIKGIQVAGFQNVVMDTVTGIQVAGFVNVLNGKMDGYQVAGFTNVTTQDVTGMQLSGFLNYARGDVDLLQLAGFGNMGHDVGGGQVSGFYNIAYGNVGGGQLTGFGNFASGDVAGWQASGFINTAKGNVDGGQITGFANFADSVNALQAAGFMNLAAGEIKGAQIAGFLNIAEQVNGIQLAPFNVADSATKGIPIGVFSFVKHGFHSFGYNASATLPISVSFKTGVDRFYNIFSIAQNPFSTEGYSALGYGLGSMERFNDKWSRAFEIEMFQLWPSNSSFRLRYNSLYEMRLKFGRQLGKKFMLQAGPHWAVHHRDRIEGNIPSDINPFGFRTFNLGDTQWSTWVGGSVSLSLVY